MVRNGRACAQAYSERGGDRRGRAARASTIGDVTPKAAALPSYTAPVQGGRGVAHSCKTPPSGPFHVSPLPPHATTARYSMIHSGRRSFFRKLFRAQDWQHASSKRSLPPRRSRPPHPQQQCRRFRLQVPRTQATSSRTDRPLTPLPCPRQPRRWPEPWRRASS